MGTCFTIYIQIQVMKNKNLGVGERLRSKAGRTNGSWAPGTNILTVLALPSGPVKLRTHKNQLGKHSTPGPEAGGLTRTESPSYKTSQSGVEIPIS